MDLTAHTKIKTPTAVAEFLISGFRSFEETVIEIQNRIIKYTERLLRDESYRLTDVTQRLNFISIKLTTSLYNRLEGLRKRPAEFGKTVH